MYVGIPISIQDDPNLMGTYRNLLRVTSGHVNGGTGDDPDYGDYPDQQSGQVAIDEEEGDSDRPGMVDCMSILPTF